MPTLFGALPVADDPLGYFLLFMFLSLPVVYFFIYYVEQKKF